MQTPPHRVSCSPCHAEDHPLALSREDRMTALSYAHGVSLTPLLAQTIGANLRDTVARHADREALVVRAQNYRATYRQLWDVVARAGRALLALGVQAGDRVG